MIHMIAYEQLQALVTRLLIERDDETSETAPWNIASLRLLFALMPLTACPGAIVVPAAKFLHVDTLLDLANSRVEPIRYANRGLHAYLSGCPGLENDRAEYIHIKRHTVAREFHNQVLLISGLAQLSRMPPIALSPHEENEEGSPRAAADAAMR